MCHRLIPYRMLPSVVTLSPTANKHATPAPLLFIVTQTELEEYSRFVYKVYAQNNAGDLGWEPSEAEAQSFIAEDQKYFPHSLYVGFKTIEGVLLSTLKITHNKPQLTFPMQEEFGISVSSLADKYHTQPQQFFHLGRLSVDKSRLASSGPGSRELFTRMLYRCLFFTTWTAEGHIFAEAAEPAVHLFEQIGLPMDLVGEPTFHTGTHTYPVVIPPRVINKWLADHYHLM